MPKMHYSPCRKRFIIASAQCCTKPLSKVISKIFRHIFDQIRNFHDKCKFYKNYNKFWVIQNNFPVLSKLDALNKKKKAREISTFDFSALSLNYPMMTSFACWVRWFISLSMAENLREMVIGISSLYTATRVTGQRNAMATPHLDKIKSSNLRHISLSSVIFNSVTLY